MNSYNPKYHHRRTIRLQGYGYSQAGLYFITLCVAGTSTYLVMEANTEYNLESWMV